MVGSIKSANGSMTERNGEEIRYLHRCIFSIAFLWKPRAARGVCGQEIGCGLKDRRNSKPKATCLCDARCGGPSDRIKTHNPRFPARCAGLECRRTFGAVEP